MLSNVRGGARVGGAARRWGPAVSAQCGGDRGVHRPTHVLLLLWMHLPRRRRCLLLLLPTPGFVARLLLLLLLVLSATSDRAATLLVRDELASRVRNG